MFPDKQAVSEIKDIIQFFFYKSEIKGIERLSNTWSSLPKKGDHAEKLLYLIKKMKNAQKVT